MRKINDLHISKLTNKSKNIKIAAKRTVAFVLLTSMIGSFGINGADAFSATKYTTERTYVEEQIYSSISQRTQSLINTQYLINKLGIILGYDVVPNDYYNCNLNRLKEELIKYLSPQDTNKLIKNIDTLLIIDFIIDNNDFSTTEKKDEYKVSKDNYNRIYMDTEELLVSLFENKTNMKINDSRIGKMLFGLYILKKNGEEPNEDYVIYDAKQYDKDNYLVTLTFWGSYSLFIGDIDGLNKTMEEEIALWKEYEKEIAEGIGAEKVYVDASSSDSKGTSICVHHISLKVPTEELDTYDYDGVVNNMYQMFSKDTDKTKVNNF